MISLEAYTTEIYQWQIIFPMTCWATFMFCIRQATQMETMVTITFAFSSFLSADEADLISTECRIFFYRDYLCNVLKSQVIYCLKRL